MNGSIWFINKWRKPLKRVGKTGVKTYLKNCSKQPMIAPLNRPSKTSRYSQDDLSVDRPVDRPTVRILTVVPAVDRPVDRGKDTESRALCRSTARSTGALSREQLLFGGRPHGRPAHPVHIGRPLRLTGSWSGRPVGRPPEPGRL